MNTNVIAPIIFVLLADLAPAEQWLFPVQNSHPTIPTESELLLNQSADLAIWEHASRNYVMRFIDPEAPFPGTNVIHIYTILPKAKNKGYTRETVTLKVVKTDSKTTWRLAKKESQSLDSQQVEKCHALFKQLLLSIRYIDAVMGPGPDEATIKWECSRELDGFGYRMQATQFGFPRADKDSKLIEEISRVLIGPVSNER